ncbi:MAG: hypothetical protein DMF05_02555 [Verrucomicrobia bacterium]|nr:MAG: hypothetical protein DMF05_02555 [Verrucomicrobiota bacterium]
MLNELREAVRKIPFEPFWIDLSSGSEDSGAASDHVWVREPRAVLEDEKGTIHILSPLHIARIRSQPRESAA